MLTLSLNSSTTTAALMENMKMKIVKTASEQNVISQIFRPITTVRLQVVAEKSGMYSWGDNKFIEYFVSWVGKPIHSEMTLKWAIRVR